MILEPPKIKSDTISTVSPSISHEVMGPDAIFVFWMLSFKPTFSLSSFTFIKRLFSSSYTQRQKTQNSQYNTEEGLSQRANITKFQDLLEDFQNQESVSPTNQDSV